MSRKAPPGNYARVGDSTYVTTIKDGEDIWATLGRAWDSINERAHLWGHHVFGGEAYHEAGLYVCIAFDMWMHEDTFFPQETDTIH